jgi:hypothetical protein
MSSLNLRKNVTVVAAQAADSGVRPEKILRIFFTKKNCKTFKTIKQLIYRTLVPDIRKVKYRAAKKGFKNLLQKYKHTALLFVFSYSR